VTRTAAAHAALAAAFLVLAVGSIVRTFPDTWDWLGAQRSQLQGLSAIDRVEAAGYKSFLPVEGFNFFRARLHPDDRYYLLAPPGNSFRGVDLPTAARTFGRYYLLPAIAVEDPRRASVVLSLGPDPRTLGLRYQRLEREPGVPWVVARIRE
jgi:hypothetical protein